MRIPRIHAIRTALCILVILLSVVTVSSVISFGQQPSYIADRQTLHTRAAAPLGAQPISRLLGSQQMKLSIMLPVGDKEELDRQVQQIYDPASPEYHHYLSVEDFTDRFGPTVVDHERVKGFAQSYGLQVTHTYRNRMEIEVVGKVSDIERAFNVHLYQYQHPTENRTYYAPDSEPTVEAGIPVWGVKGLSSYDQPHRPYATPEKKAAQRRILNDILQGRLKRPGAETTGSGVHSDLNMGTLPNEGWFYYLRSGYAGETPLTGSGQAVGLVDGEYLYSDIYIYYNTSQQQANVPPIVNAFSDVGICDATDPNWVSAPWFCSNGEVNLDVLAAQNMAPGAAAVILYDYEAQAASDNIVKQFSSSYGWGGCYLDDGNEPIREEMSAQGQTYYSATGDGAAYFGDFGMPTDSPYVTSVGGTLLTVDNNGSWQSETVGWFDSTGYDPANMDPQGCIPIPTNPPFPWSQAPAITSANEGSLISRNYPDVASDATSGTSEAAPTWAGVTALINQQAAENATASGSNHPIGTINAVIYPLGLAGGATYANTFHDITTGNNDNGQPCAPYTSCLPNGDQGFAAIPGYDLASGWGTPNGPTIFTTLYPNTSNPNFSLTSSPSALNLTPGGTGTSTITLKGLDGFTGTAKLKAVIAGAGGTDDETFGMTASLSASSVSCGGSVTLTVTTTSGVTQGGNYLVAVQGTSGNLTQTAFVNVYLPAFVDLGMKNLPSFNLYYGMGYPVNQGSTVGLPIAAWGLNGFNAPVSLAVSSMPSGITASFNPATLSSWSTWPYTPANWEESNVTLNVSDNATLFGTTCSTGAYWPNGIVEGTAAGYPTITGYIPLVVNPALSGGMGTPVNLSSYYNAAGFYTVADQSSIPSSGTLWSSGTGGNVFPADVLEPNGVTRLNYSGTQFDLGPANTNDVVAGTGQTITLPSGSYSRLELLGIAAPAQSSQQFIVNYTNGSSNTFTQSLSNIGSAYNPGGYPPVGCTTNSGEDVAVVSPYMVSTDVIWSSWNTINHYSFALDSRKTVKSLTLPNNSYVFIFAATLSGATSGGYTLTTGGTGVVSVAPGSSGTTTITSTVTGSYSTAVTLSASNLPTGVRAKFSPRSITTTGTSTLSLNVAPTTAPGTYNITVTGTSGSRTNTTSVVLTVAPSSWSFAPAPVSILGVAQESSGTTIISVMAAGNFNSVVALSYSNLPSGLTASLNPTSITGSGTSALTVNAFANIPPDTYYIKITGKSGSITHSVIVPVNIVIGFGLGVTIPNMFVGLGQSGTQSITSWANGSFSSTIFLSIANLPAGVTASLSPTAISPGAPSTLRLTVASTATPGTYNIKVTGTSGSLIEPQPVLLHVITQTPVSLSSAFNRTGIYNDGDSFSSSGGLDGNGYAYSSWEVGMFQNIQNGIPFNLGTADVPDVVSGAGQIITLPAGKFSSLKMLGTGVNGNQPSQKFTVTYADGTTSSFAQSMSDWSTPQSYSGESDAAMMQYRDVSNGTEDNSQAYYLYGYSFSLNHMKTAKSITLPNNSNVEVLAITLVPHCEH